MTCQLHEQTIHFRTKQRYILQIRRKQEWWILECKKLRMIVLGNWNKRRTIFFWKWERAVLMIRIYLKGFIINWPIVEETLTSGKYVSLFVISILYIYKIKKITWQPTYLLKKYAKTGNQRKLRKWREQMHSVCCYSSSENINCQSIQAARKKYANDIKRALDFYYYSPFLNGNI